MERVFRDKGKASYVENAVIWLWSQNTPPLKVAVRRCGGQTKGGQSCGAAANSTGFCRAHANQKKA